jgi:hypothetical protein
MITARIIIGAAILLALAMLDLVRNRSRATRWREYLFLVACTVAAMIYGIINDQITSRISWEYFYYAKGLDQALGTNIPPDAAQLHWRAIMVGLQATWWVGLLVGALLLIANNPWRDVPRLSYAALFKMLAILFAITLVSAGVLGCAGYLGWLNDLTADTHEWAEFDLIRTKPFFCVWGIHLGGYFGGLLGTIVAVLLITRARRSMRHDTSPALPSIPH